MSLHSEFLYWTAAALRLLGTNSYHRGLWGLHEATLFLGVSSRTAHDSPRGFLTKDRSCFAALGLLVRSMDQVIPQKDRKKSIGRKRQEGAWLAPSAC